MRPLRTVRAAALLALLSLPAAADEITVFAAASLGDALSEAATTWEAETGHDVTLAPAGSSTLARQIAQGAPADLFVSANTEWMDWLEERDLIDPASRRILMANTLVLIGHGAGAGTPARLTRDDDIVGRLPDDARLAMALVDAVPAGLYGRAALDWMGQWENLAPRVAQFDNVRAALAVVALGEAPLGIVYATDALAEPRVHVVGVFPKESHPPILHPGAVTADAAAPDAARAFLDWLAGARAQAILAAHGFAPPPPSG